MSGQRFAYVLGALGIWCGAAQAHGGGLDAAGCHHDRKNGGYHCHRAPGVTPAVPATRAAGSIQPVMPAAPARPSGCYVGPRGGTYTITASGRKNYKGC